jgi:hypothetical protein
VPDTLDGHGLRRAGRLENEVAVAYRRRVGTVTGRPENRQEAADDCVSKKRFHLTGVPREYGHEYTECAPAVVIGREFDLSSALRARIGLWVEGGIGRPVLPCSSPRLADRFGPGRRECLRSASGAARPGAGAEATLRSVRLCSNVRTERGKARRDRRSRVFSL